MVQIELILILLLAVVVLFLFWYFFLIDANVSLILAEKFGRPVSVYRDKVVWVTGASTGLGEAMAYELASVGAKLVLTARNKSLLTQVKNNCLEKSKGKLNADDILVLSFDVTQFEVLKEKLNDVLNHFGKVDVLVNNAARYQIGRVEDVENEVENDLFDINFFASIRLSKTILKHFKARGRGQIVVITSMSGKFGVPSCALYTATKYALHGYYESLRMEHHFDNIDITLVCPGIFESAMGSQTMGIKKGQLFAGDNVNAHYECTEMAPSRCAHLTLLASANRMWEAWVANQPFLLMLWVSQYMPDTFRRIMLSVIYSRKRVKELTEGQWPKDIPTWQPLFK